MARDETDEDRPPPELRQVELRLHPVSRACAVVPRAARDARIAAIDSAVAVLILAAGIGQVAPLDVAVVAGWSLIEAGVEGAVLGVADAGPDQLREAEG